MLMQGVECCTDCCVCLFFVAQTTSAGNGLSFIQVLYAGAISGLHLLPIYPSSGDGGFAPLTYQDVDPKFGDWEDVKALGAEYDLQMECMVNHISPASREFQDYLAKGEESEFKELFIDWNKLWGGGPYNKTLANNKQTPNGCAWTQDIDNCGLQQADDLS